MISANNAHHDYDRMYAMVVACNLLRIKAAYACHPGRHLSGGLTAVVSGHPGLRLRLFVHITHGYALQSLHVFLHQDLVVLHHFQLTNLGLNRQK